jgi:hypothetical protein
MPAPGTILSNLKYASGMPNSPWRVCFFTAASNSAYSGYPELWILRYPAHTYRAVPSPGFEPTTLWLRVRRPNHSATTVH